MTMEYRSRPCEIRAAEGGQHVEGFALVYDTWSEMLAGPQGFRERIQRGAVKLSSNPRALVNHEGGKLLASLKSGTLTLEDRPEGLWMRAKLPDTSYASDLRALMAAGMMEQQSFAFVVRAANGKRGEQWEMRDGISWRTLTDIEVEEVSLVDNPAYPQTSAHLRSADAVLAEYRAQVPEHSGGGELPLDLAERGLALVRCQMIR